MVGLLAAILCVLKNILLAVLYAGTFVVNLIIVAAAAFVALLVALLPGMPDVPDAPGGTAIGWMAWFYPVADVVAALATFAALLLTYKLVQIALRWMKADA